MGLSSGRSTLGLSGSTFSGIGRMRSRWPRKRVGLRGLFRSDRRVGLTWAARFSCCEVPSSPYDEMHPGIISQNYKRPFYSN